MTGIITVDINQSGWSFLAFRISKMVNIRLYAGLCFFEASFWAKSEGFFQSLFFTTNTDIFGVSFRSIRNYEFSGFQHYWFSRSTTKFMFKCRNKRAKELPKHFFSTGAFASRPSRGDTEGAWITNLVVLRRRQGGKEARRHITRRHVRKLTQQKVPEERLIRGGGGGGRRCVLQCGCL